MTKRTNSKRFASQASLSTFNIRVKQKPFYKRQNYNSQMIQIPVDLYYPKKTYVSPFHSQAINNEAPCHRKRHDT